ncbi:YheU family protein [Saccharospirillum impatiens]|uniref:YheU family protein n=1 Tax=Saccharospirillum impatiens TaxID=169438 RepID=UPI000403C21C|nr:YheU family protein [Saccharospirillum impatiens]
MIIPPEQLAPETLDGIVREWLMRQGEDWGLVEGGLDEAVPQARARVLDGDLVILWSETEETLNIMPRDEVRRSDQKEAWEDQTGSGTNEHDRDQSGDA